jgi:16S rRNA (uracil1498-N3)-methyltransferase
MMEILEVLSPPSPPRLKIHLGQGLPKGDKMDSIVRKCTELGVDRITPLIMERCVVQWKSERRTRIERWRKIAFEAAQQSGRWNVPEIDEPESYPDFLDRPIRRDLGLILWEGDTGQRLKPLLEENRQGREEGSPTFHCLLIVGPEGGFGPGEVSLAERKGLTPVTLGERTLRTETAGPTALAILQYAVGDMG